MQKFLRSPNVDVEILAKSQNVEIWLFQIAITLTSCHQSSPECDYEGFQCTLGFTFVSIATLCRHILGFIALSYVPPTSLSINGRSFLLSSFLFWCLFYFVLLLYNLVMNNIEGRQGHIGWRICVLVLEVHAWIFTAVHHPHGCAGVVTIDLVSWGTYLLWDLLIDSNLFALGYLVQRPCALLVQIARSMMKCLIVSKFRWSCLVLHSV